VGSVWLKESWIRRGSRSPPHEKGQFWGKGLSIVKYRDFPPWAVQKRLNRSICRLGCGLGWAMGTLAPTGEYNWTVRLRRRYGLMSNYFDHLFLIGLLVIYSNCWNSPNWQNGTAMCVESLSIRPEYLFITAPVCNSASTNIVDFCSREQSSLTVETGSRARRNLSSAKYTIGWR